MKNILLFVFLVLSIISIGQTAGDFRSKSAGPSNWNDFNSWEKYDGTVWNPAIAGELPSATSKVEIQSGHSMILNAAGLTSATLTVNGSLSYHATTVSSLTVNGYVIVNSGGSFTSPSSGTVVTHSLTVAGGMKIDGSFNMNVFSTAAVPVTFTGAANDSIYGSGTISFYSLTVNKGSAITNVLEAKSVISIVPPVSDGQRLTVNNGTFKLSSASVLSPYYGQQVVAQGTAQLWLNHPSAVVQRVGSGTSTVAGRLLVYGTLHITAGTFAYGSGNDQFITQGTVIIDGPDAIFNHYGGVYLSSGSRFTMSAGNFNIYLQAANNYAGSALLFETAYSLTNIFNFTGGTITIVDPSTSSGSYAIDFNPFYTGNITYTNTGTIRFGDGSSDKSGNVNGFQIRTIATLPLGNLVINNNPSSVSTTRIAKITTSTTINGNLTINSGTANQFLTNGFVLTLNGNLINNGTFNGDVTGSGLVLSGTSQQVISGTGTFTNGTIRSITINSTSPSVPSVDLQKNLTVSTGLTLTNGTLGTTNASVFTMGRSASSATFTLTRFAGSLPLTPAFSFSGVTTINYTYSTPTPAAGVTTGNELPASQLLNTLTIGNTSGVTLDKPVSCTTLALTGILNTTAVNSVTVAGTTTGSISGGSATAFVNGPLTRTIPNNSAGANYKFPVGKGAYQLFEFASLTTSGTGTALVTVEAFDQGPFAGTAGTGLSAINTDKYWSLTANTGTVVINPSSTIKLTDAGINPFSKVAQSNTATGTYSSIGGTVSGLTVTSLSSFDQSSIGSGTYFRVGTGAAFTPGTYAIGPQASYPGYTGTFASMTAAINSMTGNPMTGNVIFEFQPDYLPSVETYPVPFTANIYSTSTATVTFRPAASVGALITFSSTGAVITNTGADYITFDGRNGGTGTNMYLKFSSTSASAATVTVGTNSTYNSFLYCMFKGSTTAASTGVFTGGSNLNTGLIIDHCDFDASGTANSCLYLTTGFPDVSITNSDFYNYRNGYGVYVPSGSTNAIVDNNSIFQTTAYNSFAGTTTGIYLTSSTNSRVSNNKIGGSGTGLTGTWTINATSPAGYNFTGINVTSMGSGSTVYNNRIGKFDWKCTVCTWTGINGGGTGNIGTLGGNVIGDSTGVDNIKITYYNTGAATVNGIITSGVVPVEYNVVGSITTLLSGVTATGCSFNGISNSGSGGINNNVIGSRTTANSINIAAQSATGSNQNVYGIYFPGSGTLNINNNIVANIKNGSSVSSGSTKGIYIPNNGTALNVTNNNVYSITTSQPNTGTGFTLASLDGICMQSAGSVYTVTGNKIYDLVNNTPTVAVNVNGIYYNGNTGTGNIIEGNLIHSIKTSSNTSVQNGININYGLCTLRNNVIRLGIDKDGVSQTNTAQINGILKATGTSGAVNIYFNTVYIGGSGVAAGAVYTRCLNISAHTTEDIRDNIFANMRTNAAANPVHNAIAIPSGITSNYTSDYNIYQVSSTDGRLARIGTTDITNMGALQFAMTGNDLHSGFGNPKLISPETGIALMNLKPQTLTPVEGTGIDIPSVTNDFTGAVRSTLTPVDIGAYADNYTIPSANEDIWFPVINYSTLANTGSTANRVLNSFATITDYFTGVDTTAGTRPRIYYKKSTDANVFGGNTSADNGWKWTEASDNNSPFNFTIDYSIINGGSVVIGDVIQYFVVAQDKATIPNVSFNPSNGASGSSVNPAGMTAPGTPYSYTIYPTIPSAVEVGTGYPYTTLTGTLASGGLFAAINAGVITSNVVATIKTDIVEPGTVALNQIIEEGAGAGTYTLTIQADGAAHLISGGTSPYTAPMIPINGASRVIIDGGSGKYLTFRNANAAYNTTGPVIQFNNGSQNCTVQNCYLESNAYAYQAPFVAAEIVIGSGTNSVTISNNDFRDARGVANPNYPRGGIYSSSANNSLVITSNNFYNFRNAFTNEPGGWGIMLNAVANGAVITGNSFYMESGITPVSGIICIYINGGNNHNISNNYMGGSGPLCTGTWTATNVQSWPTYGIYLTGVTAPASTVQGNVFNNFNWTSGGWFTGIYVYNSVANITGNTIGHPSTPNSIRFNGGISYGINVTSPTAACNIDGNTVANITITSAVSPNIYGIYSSGGNVRKNKIYNLGASLANGTPVIYGLFNASAFASNEFSNNMISLDGGIATNPTIVGFYDVSNATSSNINVYFNSVSISGTATGTTQTSAFRRNQNTPMTLRNNIFSNTRTGGTGVHYAVYFATTATLSSDYNDLYVAGSTLGYFGTAKTSFAAWQAIPQDLNSKNVNPSFVSTTDLHTSVVQLNNTGVAIPGITDDLNNDIRTNPPDMGCYEFTIPVILHTLSATSVTTGGATLNGDINSQNEVTDMAFEYGLTTSYGSTVAGIPPTLQTLVLTPVSKAVTGLTPGTTYHFRIRGISQTSGDTAYGADSTFITLSPSLSGPNNVCEGVTSIYSTDPGFQNYSWVVSAGGTIISGGSATDDSVTVQWTTPGPNSVSVNYENPVGFPAPSPTVLPVQVNPNLPVSVTIAINPSGMVCSGTLLTFTATPVNGGLTPAYQWYVGSNPKGTNNPVYSSDTLKNGDQVSVVLTSSEICQSGGPATSNIISVQMRAPLAAPGVPANQVLCFGGMAADIVATPASGGSGPYTYHWQESFDGLVWNDLTGETSLTYSPGIMFSTNNFRLKATDAGTPSCGDIYSSIVTITVNDPLTPSVISSDQTICNGTAPALLTSTPPTGGTSPYGYQWQRKTTGSWGNIPGATGISYQPGLLTQTTQYRLIIFDLGVPSCGSTVSNVITVTVQSPVLAGSIQQDQTICSGSTPAPLTSVTPGSGSGPITYTWDESTDNGLTWTSIPGATGTGYTPGALTQTTKYHRIAVSTLNGTECRDTTIAVTITVYQQPLADFSASNTTPPLNTDVTFTDLSTGDVTTWSWSFSPATVVYVNGTSASSQNPVVQFTANGHYDVTLSITNPACSSSVTKTNYIIIGTPGLWTGLTSNDWNTPSNWSDYTVPSAVTDVLIPATAVNWPVVSGSLTIGTDCVSLTLEPSSSMTITGDLIISSTSILHNSGNLTVNGNLTVQ